MVFRDEVVITAQSKKEGVKLDSEGQARVGSQRLPRAKVKRIVKGGKKSSRL